MSDYEFLKLFKSNLSLKLSAYDIISRTKLKKEIVDIKLDSLINSNYISFENIEEEIRGESIIYTNRWGNDENIEIKSHSYEELFLTKYFITNLGNEFFLLEKQKINNLIWSNRRSWIAIFISLVALIITAYNVLF